MPAGTALHSVLHTKQLLKQSDTVGAALARLDECAPKLCLVIDDNQALVRTVSDGDIRRGLLKNLSLSSRLSELDGRNPITASSDESEEQLLALMRDEHISTVVLVDSAHRPTGLISLAHIEETILLSPPHIGLHEAEYVRTALESNWIAPAGPNLFAFEEGIAKLSDQKHAIAVSSGTAGLHLALRALDLPPNCSVYVSDKTFVASVQPILYEQLTPVLIDSEPETWNMSPSALQKRLEKDNANGSLPGAIILVHLYGQPARLDILCALANQYGIPIIEDAAESLGARYNGQPSGSHCRIGIYSFNGNKIITTSGGGAVVTNDQVIAERVRHLASQGREPYEHYQHSEVAYNYRMSNLLAGVGLGQLHILADHVKRRREIFLQYQKGLESIPGISFQKEAAGSFGNRWLTVIKLDPNKITMHPYLLMRAMKKQGIETRPSWKPMHMQPLCRRFAFEPHSSHEVVSSSLFLNCLCLPSGSNLTDTEVNHIISSIRSILTREKS